MNALEDQQCLCLLTSATRVYVACRSLLQDNQTSVFNLQFSVHWDPIAALDQIWIDYSLPGHWQISSLVKFHFGELLVRAISDSCPSYDSVVSERNPAFCVNRLEPAAGCKREHSGMACQSPLGSYDWTDLITQQILSRPRP